eukprot:60369_1
MDCRGKSTFSQATTSEKNETEHSNDATTITAKPSNFVVNWIGNGTISITFSQQFKSNKFTHFKFEYYYTFNDKRFNKFGTKPMVSNDDDIKTERVDDSKSQFNLNGFLCGNCYTDCNSHCMYCVQKFSFHTSNINCNIQDVPIQRIRRKLLSKDHVQIDNNFEAPNIHLHVKLVGIGKMKYYYNKYIPTAVDKKMVIWCNAQEMKEFVNLNHYATKLNIFNPSINGNATLTRFNYLYADNLEFESLSLSKHFIFSNWNGQYRRIDVLGDCTLNEFSEINQSGTGFVNGKGISPGGKNTDQYDSASNSVKIVDQISGDGGGGYGTTGGKGNGVNGGKGGRMYGEKTLHKFLYPGSGATGSGVCGGGIIDLVVRGNLIIKENASIVCNGNNANKGTLSNPDKQDETYGGRMWCCGGGSGGSIRIVVFGDFINHGKIRAIGGDGVEFVNEQNGVKICNGQGGDGRIAIYLSKKK